MRNISLWYSKHTNSTMNMIPVQTIVFLTGNPDDNLISCFTTSEHLIGECGQNFRRKCLQGSNIFRPNIFITSDHFQWPKSGSSLKSSAKEYVGDKALGYSVDLVSFPMVRQYLNWSGTAKPHFCCSTRRRENWTFCLIKFCRAPLKELESKLNCLKINSYRAESLLWIHTHESGHY